MLQLVVSISFYMSICFDLDVLKLLRDDHDEEGVRHLIENVNGLQDVKDRFGRTIAYIIARCTDNPALLQACIFNGADPHQVSNDGQNLLHYAVLGENVQVMDWLSSNNPNLLRGEDNDGETPYEYALYLDSLKNVLQILSAK